MKLAAPRPTHLKCRAMTIMVAKADESEEGPAAKRAKDATDIVAGNLGDESDDDLKDNNKAKNDANSHSQNSFPDEIQNSMKLIETIGIQKKVLEDENEELKSRISELMNDRSAYGSTSPVEAAAAVAGNHRNLVPFLNIGNEQQHDNY